MNESLTSIIDSDSFKGLLDEAISQRLANFVQQQEEKAKEFSLIERIFKVEQAIQAQQKVMESLQREMIARFETSDKRFESLQREMNARFEAMDKRFEALQKEMNARFAALQREMNARFEAVDKRFSFLQWVVIGGFTFLSILITLVNLVK